MLIEELVSCRTHGACVYVENKNQVPILRAWCWFCHTDGEEDEAYGNTQSFSGGPKLTKGPVHVEDGDVYMTRTAQNNSQAKHPGW